jgi:hypothetical protein
MAVGTLSSIGEHFLDILPYFRVTVDAVVGLYWRDDKEIAEKKFLGLGCVLSSSLLPERYSEKIGLKIRTIFYSNGMRNDAIVINKSKKLYAPPHFSFAVTYDKSNKN